VIQQVCLLKEMTQPEENHSVQDTNVILQKIRQVQDIGRAINGGPTHR